MAKNLAENSGSFGRKDENQSNAGDTPRSPMADPKDTDPKPDGEATETEQPENQNDDATEEKKEEATEETETPPCTPLPSLEKVSEDIDQLLALPQKNDSEKEATPFEIPGYVERFLYLVEEKIGRLDAGEERGKDDSLIEEVNRISNLIKFLSHQQEPPHSPSSGEETNKRKEWLMNRIGLVQQRAMSYLEDDFRSLMEHSRSRTTELDPGGNDHKGKHVAEQQQQNQDPDPDQPEESDPEFPGYSEETITSLKKIASEMIFGGYQSECLQVYMISRRIALDDALQKLGFEKMSMDEIQKVQWDTLAGDMIPAWISTLKHCATVYFPGERRLSEAVFGSPMEESAGLFSNLTRGVVIQLLNFAEGIAMTKHAGEKLFKLLDMYETLRDAIPKVEELFPEESVTEEMRTEMTLAKGRLGEAAISMFSYFENSVKSETAKTPVPGGAVHPLTRYIMNYLTMAGDYKETLEQVFKDYSKIERADSTSRPHHDEVEKRNDTVGENASSPFAALVMRVMELLDSSLEVKARLYRDVALSNLFMMNNGRYILQKIKGSSEMCHLMGDTWCRKRSSELRTYHQTYKRETWNRVLLCLSNEGMTVNGKVQKPVLKERFKSFNALFDEIHRTQSSWVVKDEQLQSELRVSISSVVIPAYRSFLGRFSQYLDPGRQTEKYIKYQIEDIETCIDELFDGKPHQSIARRKT